MLRVILTFTLLFAVLLSESFSQTEKLSDKLPDELNQEQWEYVRDLYAVDAIKLLAKMDTLNAEIDSLKKLKEFTDNFDCETELLAIVGATKEQVADFRIKFDETERKIKSSNSTPDDASMKYLEEISSSRIKCLPEFNDRFNNLNKFIADINTNKNNNNTESKGSYTVVKGDCLWKISARSYSTPYLWPAIWEANRSEIFDPNFIYPGEVLKIPMINDEDRKNAMERSKHYRKSRKKQNNLQN